MKRLLFLLTLSPVAVCSQGLLLNGGFEDMNTCTEYRIECAPEAWISTGAGFESYITDAGRAHTGTHCMAIEAGHVTRPYERSFIRSQLVCLLKPGNHYRLELYIKSPHPILDSIGVYFGTIEPLLERKPIYRLSPTLYLRNGLNNFMRDSSWQRAVLDYTARGDEKFITIANYSRNDITGSTGLRRTNHFLVFIDDISLVPLDPNERLCTNWREVKQVIYDQNERHQYLDRILRYRRIDSTHQSVALAPTTVVRLDTLLLPDVLFASGKKELHTESYALLDSFCSRMQGKFIDSLVIEGHADSTGTAVLNEQLAAGRAEATAAYLQGCAFFRNAAIVTRGWGSRKPIAPNNTPVNRRKNRRVTLLVYFRE